MSKYAENTTVDVERSIGEILSTFKRYECSAYAHAVHNGIHQVMFSKGGRSYRMSIPPVDVKNYTRTETGRQRTPEVAQKDADKEMRRRARVLLLLIKAKFEACAIEDSSVEKEFMGDMILPSGRTVFEWSQSEFPKLGPGQEPSFQLQLTSGLGND